MTIETHLNEIRAAIAVLSVAHAKGELTRADINCAVNFIEDRCDDVAALADQAAPPMNFGSKALPILSLHQVAAQMRADGAAARAAARSHLALVSNGGDAA